MKVLAIETSCDDTCISIIKASGSPPSLKLRRARKRLNFDILSNIVSSQVEVHKKWGGVHPTLAKREHQKNLVPALKKALKKAKMLKISKQSNPTGSPLRVQQKQPSVESLTLLNPAKFQKLKKILEREEYLLKKVEKFLNRYQKPGVDLIAITVGPGLEPCLWVGVNFAKAIAFFWDIPIITVNHIKAHIFVNEINRKPLTQKDFPAVCLIVSGGNTQLFLMEDFGKYKILGETRDDAAGECFDKVAKILGLGYPGGPVIAAKAKETRSPLADGERVSFKLPRPMINQKNYDFSFSGLKTAVLYNFKSQTPKTRKSKQYIKEMCYETQQAIIDVLISKTVKAAKAYKAKIIILGGGVSANRELQRQFQQKIKKEKLNFRFRAPSFKFCTDNAAMVAVTGYFKWKKMKKAENWQDIKAVANLRIT